MLIYVVTSERYTPNRTNLSKFRKGNHNIWFQFNGR